jgi:hypothetical protein
MSRDGRDEDKVEGAEVDAIVDVVDAEGERLVRVVVLAVVVVVEVELAAVLDESIDEEVVAVVVVDVEVGGVMICHWGSGRDGLREAGSGRRRTVGWSGSSSSSSSEEDGDEPLTGESRMRLDSLG